MHFEGGCDKDARPRSGCGCRGWKEWKEWPAPDLRRHSKSKFTDALVLNRDTDAFLLNGDEMVGLVSKAHARPTFRSFLAGNPAIGWRWSLNMGRGARAFKSPVFRRRDDAKAGAIEIMRTLLKAPPGGGAGR
jgi:hypothetical protein